MFSCHENCSWYLGNGIWVWGNRYSEAGALFTLSVCNAAAVICTICMATGWFTFSQLLPSRVFSFLPSSANSAVCKSVIFILWGPKGATVLVCGLWKSKFEKHSCGPLYQFLIFWFWVLCLVWQRKKGTHIKYGKKKIGVMKHGFQLVLCIINDFTMRRA